MKIYLHVGAPKCASSTIQQHFSHNHSQGKFAYGVISVNHEKIVIGNDVEIVALRGNANHFSSYEFLEGKEYTESFKHKIAEDLKLYSQSIDTLFLSYEGWEKCSGLFHDFSDVFGQYEVEIIFVIRPFVQWYNSYWWQRAHWDPECKGPESLVEQRQEYVEWDTYYHSFKSLSFVKKVHLLTLQSNIIEQTYNIMSVPYRFTQDKRSNVSSSAEFLNFLSQNRQLRPYGDDTIEFALNRYLKKRSATPWVLTQENIASILAAYREDSLKLAPYISNENILENPLWWEVSAYEDKIARCSRDTSLSKEILADMLEEASEIIDSLVTQIKSQHDAKYKQKSLKEGKIAFYFTHFLLSPQIIYEYYRTISELTSGSVRQHYKNKKFQIYRQVMLNRRVVNYKKQRQECKGKDNISFEMLSHLLVDAYCIIKELDVQLRCLVSEYRAVELQKK